MGIQSPRELATSARPGRRSQPRRHPTRAEPRSFRDTKKRLFLACPYHQIEALALDLCTLGPMNETLPCALSPSLRQRAERQVGWAAHPRVLRSPSALLVGCALCTG